MSRYTRLPDGSAFFVATVPHTNPLPPVHWNPGNKVVCDHRNGEIIQPDTNVARKARGLPVPWTPEIGEVECRQPDIN